MAIVKELLEQQGLGRKEIVERTGFSYNTVGAYLYMLRNPEKAKAQMKAWNSSEKGMASRKISSSEWRKRNPAKEAKKKQVALEKNQKLTRSVARNHYQRWTIREIEYLQQHGPTKTRREHALYLGRTYKAIAHALRFGGITFRDTKPDTPRMPAITVAVQDNVGA
ncbi:MAG: hypothetical protein Q7S09_01595 [bacterium]|nr:hypothetical protein [bacterium]